MSLQTISGQQLLPLASQNPNGVFYLVDATKFVVEHTPDGKIVFVRKDDPIDDASSSDAPSVVLSEKNLTLLEMLKRFLDLMDKNSNGSGHEQKIRNVFSKCIAKLEGGDSLNSRTYCILADTIVQLKYRCYDRKDPSQGKSKVWMNCNNQTHGATFEFDTNPLRSSYDDLDNCLILVMEMIRAFKNFSNYRLPCDANVYKAFSSIKTTYSDKAGQKKKDLLLSLIVKK